MAHDPIRNALAELVRLKGIKECIEAGKASNIERGEYSFLKEAAWENARAALRAQPAAATVPGDEREAFEAWAKERDYSFDDEGGDPLWCAWRAGAAKARAALAAPAARQEHDWKAMAEAARRIGLTFLKGADGRYTLRQLGEAKAQNSEPQEQPSDDGWMEEFCALLDDFAIAVSAVTTRERRQWSHGRDDIRAREALEAHVQRIRADLLPRYGAAPQAGETK